MAAAIPEAAGAVEGGAAAGAEAGRNRQEALGPPLKTTVEGAGGRLDGAPAGERGAGRAEQRCGKGRPGTKGR